MKRYSSAFFQELLDNLQDGVYYVDATRRITFWNKAAEIISGYNQKEVLGHRCSDNILRHVDDLGTCLCLSSCPLAAAIQDGQPRAAVVYLHHKDGHRVPVSVRITPLRNRAGLITGAIEIFSDNSEKVAALQRLKELEGMAYLDPLTGIANRKYLDIFLDSRFNEFKRYGWPFGLIFMDIDHFKGVNDAYGHQAGDLAIKMVANTLAQNCRSFDLVGRWGGDEFLCVMGHLKMLNELEQAAQRFRQLIANAALHLNGTSITVTTSMGATLIRPEDTVVSITDRVDHLLYQSKEGGRNRLQLA
jgi:diguanylate cyclase (GGDEF)-like protein/PAS domain S-box-containing protein